MPEQKSIDDAVVETMAKSKGKLEYWMAEVERPIIPQSHNESRKKCRKVVDSLLEVMEMTSAHGTALWSMHSELFEPTKNLISKIVHTLETEVYSSKECEVLIANEWLLIQNDLAYFMQIADHAPCFGPLLGELFG